MPLGWTVFQCLILFVATWSARVRFRRSSSRFLAGTHHAGEEAAPLAAGFDYDRICHPAQDWRLMHFRG